MSEIPVFIVGRATEKPGEREQREARVRYNEANRETLENSPILVVNARLLCALALQKAALLPGGAIGIIAGTKQLRPMARALISMLAEADIAPSGSRGNIGVELPNLCRIDLYSAEDINRLRGNGFDYLYVYDVELDDYAKNEVIYPALSDSSGSIRRVQTV